MGEDRVPLCGLVKSWQEAERKQCETDPKCDQCPAIPPHITHRQRVWLRMTAADLVDFRTPDTSHVLRDEQSQCLGRAMQLCAIRSRQWQCGLQIWR